MSVLIPVIINLYENMKIEGVTTVEDYLTALPDDRREIIQTVRKIILANLPEGYVETFGFGMIAYVIPLKHYPNTYNKQPLMLAALASQKNNCSLYLMTVYGEPKIEKWFKEEFEKSGKRLKMGKSCVHFNKIDDLPLDLIAKVIAKVSIEAYISRYEQAKRKA